MYPQKFKQIDTISKIEDNKIVKIYLITDTSFAYIRLRQICFLQQDFHQLKIFISLHLCDPSHSLSSGKPNNNNLNSSSIWNENYKHLRDNISHNQDKENEEIADQYANCWNENQTAKDKLQQQELWIESVNNYNNNIDDVKVEFSSTSTQEAIGDERNIQSIYEIYDYNSERQGNFNNIHYTKSFNNNFFILLAADGRIFLAVEIALTALSIPPSFFWVTARLACWNCKNSLAYPTMIQPFLNLTYYNITQVATRFLYSIKGILICCLEVPITWLAHSLNLTGI